MAKGWYPVINEENCVECGSCVGKCTHGVYDKSSQKPIVIYTDGCVDGCHGCQNLCPADAIEYFGDTGVATTCDCGGNC
ncbi:4Fe-4S binding protein [Eubacteriaceae bacterium ES2]|nr:4Fe-4S binding protein [Eubacteriaceae bacterium ES2]